MIAPEVVFRLGALPLQQLLLLGSEMAHLPLLGALVSGAQSFDCGAASGWLANGWLGETDGNDCRRPEKDKALTAHKDPMVEALRANGLALLLVVNALVVGLGGRGHTLRDPDLSLIYMSE